MINKGSWFLFLTKININPVPSILIIKLRIAIRSNLSFPVYAHDKSVMEVKIIIANIDQIDWTKDITVEVVEDKNNILMKDSKDKYFIVDATRKVIAGELDPKKTGVAKVQISFHLNASTGITEVRTCNFTINRQNSASN